MSIKNVLITGSAGTIGRILWTGLCDRFSLYGIDIAAGENKRLHRGDISQIEDLIPIFQKLPQIDCIVHLAADPRVDAEWESILKNNIIGTRNIYECARRFAVKKVIFAGSGHVVGAYEDDICKGTHDRMVTVNDAVRPDSLYGVSKVFGAALARFCFEKYRTGSIILRIGMVLADDDPTKDERFRKIWLSHRDLIQLVRKSILSDVPFGIYFGVSNNKGRFWDISNGIRELGYEPQDDASLR